MSAFAITSGLYLRAASRADGDDTRYGLVAVLEEAGSLSLKDRCEAWSLFKDLFLGPRHLQFQSKRHCIIALLMMAAICQDEESEEEGQL